MKQRINVRSKSGQFYGRTIYRVIEHVGQYIGPLTCTYKGKKYEVTDNGSGDWFIFVD